MASGCVCNIRIYSEKKLLRETKRLGNVVNCGYGIPTTQKQTHAAVSPQ